MYIDPEKYAVGTKHSIGGEETNTKNTLRILTVLHYTPKGVFFGVEPGTYAGGNKEMFVHCNDTAFWPQIKPYSPVEYAWINIYPKGSSHVGTVKWDSKTEEDKASGPDRLACIKINLNTGEAVNEAIR